MFLEELNPNAQPRPNIIYLLGTGSDMAEVRGALECRTGSLPDVRRVRAGDWTLAQT